ncbi:hypothetical protein B0H11DRAFT_1993254 [Mycena galericulata]|nr:hypothetical protein B0H11DRAFT_1993254 [Mycena galericulata]
MNTLSYFITAVIGVWAAGVRADCAADVSQIVPLYRDWDGVISDHFYTVLTTPRTRNGYTAEGVRLSVFPTQVSGAVQFIRLYSSAATDHFYTTNATEAQAAASRQLSPAGLDHFYTINATERDGAETSGWAYEQIAGYVFPPAAAASSAAAPPSTPTTATEFSTTTTTAAAAPPKSVSAPTSASLGAQTPVTGAAAPSDVEVTGPVLPAATTTLAAPPQIISRHRHQTPGQSAGFRPRVGRRATFLALLVLGVRWLM